MRVELDRASLPPGSRRLVVAGDVEVALFNVEGRVYALNNTCPHRGGPLVRGTVQASPDGPVLRCPMHGWSFRLADGESARPGRATVYRVELCGDVIVVDVDGDPAAESAH